MNRSRRAFVVGFTQWAGAGLTALAAYMLTLDSAADWDSFTVIRGATAHAGAGLAALALFIKNSDPVNRHPMATTKPADHADRISPLISDDDDPIDPVDQIAPRPSTSRIDLQQLRSEIKRDEGYRDHVYLDSEGNKTVGYGHLLTEHDDEFALDVGTPVSQRKIDAWFSTDIAHAMSDARRVIHDFDSHPQSVKHALVNMAFNLGRTRLAGFKQTLALINARHYEQAASEALNSKWADQVGQRAKRVAAMLANGNPEVTLT